MAKNGRLEIVLSTWNTTLPAYSSFQPQSKDMHTIMPKVYTHSFKHLIQVFQSLSWPEVYNVQHLGMQTAFTNIWERLDRSLELSDFLPWWDASCEIISSLLNIPQPEVINFCGSNGNKMAVLPQSIRVLKTLRVASVCTECPTEVGCNYSPCVCKSKYPR